MSAARFRRGSLALAALALTVPTAAHADDAKLACVTQLDRAQSLQSARKLTSARASFLACAVPSCPELVRQDCSKSAVEVEQSLPSLVFSARESGRAADGTLSIAFAGFVDEQTGVTTSANVPCADGRPMAADLAASLGRRVMVTNDADCFALAEATFGAGQGHRRIFGVILGTGVGGGLVLDGRIVGASSGVSGEWGHGPIITRSRKAALATPYFQCGCGQWGCLDTVGAARGLERLHYYVHAAAASSLEITQGWEAGDRAAAETMTYYLELVSGPLSVLLNTCGATIAPVGGGLSNCLSLVAGLDVHVRARMLKPPAEPIVVPARLGAAAGLIGAALAADDDL